MMQHDSPRRQAPRTGADTATWPAAAAACFSGESPSTKMRRSARCSAPRPLGHHKCEGRASAKTTPSPHAPRAQPGPGRKETADAKWCNLRKFQHKDNYTEVWADYRGSTGDSILPRVTNGAGVPGPRAAPSPPGQVLSPSPGQAPHLGSQDRGRGSPRKLGAGGDSMAVGGWREAAECHLPAKAAREHHPVTLLPPRPSKLPTGQAHPGLVGSGGRGSETRAAQRVGFPPQTQERKRCGTCANQGAAREPAPPLGRLPSGAQRELIQQEGRELPA